MCSSDLGYVLYDDLPHDSNGGGVGIYVKDCYVVKPLPEYKIHTTGNMKVENIWLELPKNSTKYIICGMYIV